MKRLAVSALLGFTLVACGTRPVQVIDDDQYAEAICTDSVGIRLPDTYCPIGDIYGGPFNWRYYPYRGNVSNVVTPYVGYAIPNSGWVDRRPTNITTINIIRGDIPEKPPAGVKASTVSVPTAPVTRKAATTGSSTVTRGGLGVKSAAAPVTQKVAPPPPKPAPPAPTTRKTK